MFWLIWLAIIILVPALAGVIMLRQRAALAEDDPLRDA